MIKLLFAVIGIAAILVVGLIVVAGILDAREMKWESKQMQRKENANELETILGTSDHSGTVDRIQAQRD